MAAGWYRPLAGGIAIVVRVSPNSSRARIDGPVTEADGTEMLKVAVTVPPEGGKANAALVKLLAKEWGLPKTTLSITSGAKDRRKTVTIEGDARVLEKKIVDWLGQRAA